MCWREEVKQMKKSIVRRVRWGNVLITGLLLGCLVYGGWRFTRPAQVIKTYSYTVQAGDTLWDVASDIALPQDDLRHMIWQIMEDNKIKDPGSIQPGTVIQINIERRV